MATETGMIERLSALALTIDDESQAIQVCEVVGKIDACKQRLKEIDTVFKEQLIDWINRNGDLTIGTKRYYVGTTKNTKPRDLEKLTEAVFHASQGDFEQFIKVLSANAYKPGACKTLLGDQFDEHFTVKIVEDIATGKPRKTVQVFDDRFVK